MNNTSALTRRVAEYALCSLSDFAWRHSLNFFGSRDRAVSWAGCKLSERPTASTIPLGVPRMSRSVCPKCIVEKRDAVLRGQLDLDSFRKDPGIIESAIIEEAGRILVRKVCQIHGPFEDVLATDAAFFRRMESLYKGPDFQCEKDSLVHNHGSSSIRYGRGAFLVFDLTNRCNMKCWPCFMDANAVGYVHELGIEDIKDILLRARSFKPQREVNILFSGGEPTISPVFLDAVRIARDQGFKRLHVATNGIRFAEDVEFAHQAREAGLHSVFLQLDGMSNERNAHRKVENLFDLKLQAMENLARAHLRVTLQVTIINGRNNDQVGSILDFAVRNVDRVFSIVFQPIMFAGRDEKVEDDIRYQQRYPLSQLAIDLSSQSATDWQPLRDWFPTATISQFSNILDLIQPAACNEGAVAPNEHPDWGIMCPLLVNRRTKFWIPVTRFFDLERFASDLCTIANASCGRAVAYAQLAAAILRNYKPKQAPTGFSVADLVDLFRQCSSRTKISVPEWESTELGTRAWTLFMVYGQHFQDAAVYDVKAIQTSMTPVATQEGEIAFSAHNSIWRQVVEKLHQTATLTEWHREHGRHPIYAHGDFIPIQGLQASHCEVSSVRWQK